MFNDGPQQVYKESSFGEYISLQRLRLEGLVERMNGMQILRK